VGGDRPLIVQAHMNVRAIRLGVVAFGNLHLLGVLALSVEFDISSHSV